MDQELADALWKLANKIEDIAGLSRIAGGAPRNLMTDKPIKDLDIFCHSADGITHLRRMFDADPLSGDTPEEYAGAESIFAESHQVVIYRGSYDTPSWSDPLDGLQVDLIHCKLPATKQVESFPDYLSQVWMNPHAINPPYTNHTPNWNRDWNSNTLTYVGHLMQPARLKKLQALYPERTFVDLDGGAGYAGIPRAKPRREPDHAPFWWDMKTLDPEEAMNITRLMAKGGY